MTAATPAGHSLVAGPPLQSQHQPLHVSAGPSVQWSALFSLAKLNVFISRLAFALTLTRSFATMKSTARLSCLVGVLYDISREKIY